MLDKIKDRFVLLMMPSLLYGLVYNPITALSSLIALCVVGIAKVVD